MRHSIFDGNFGIEEETPSQHEITNGKKKASKLTPAVEYSMRPNCDPVKLAKMIQQERQKGFHYVKTSMQISGN